MCITCSKKFCELTRTTITDENDISSKCAKHHNKLTNFFVERHMIPIIMQQFLIDMDARSSSKQIVKHLTNMEDSNVHHSIDLNEIDEFWNDYMQTIPNDLELIWDTIINGLIRYLQVYY